MRKTVFFIGLVLVVSCSRNPVPKPDRLLDEETMENIMYDVAVLQGASANAPEQLIEKNINPKDYIYKKYKIDSATFHQNNRYYAANVRKYKHMYKRVLERLQNQK